MWFWVARSLKPLSLTMYQINIPPGLCLGNWFSTVPSTAQQPSNNMLRHWLKEKGLGSQIDGIKISAVGRWGERKMKSLLALLFCIGALVASTAAKLLYEQLPEQHRRAIDRTVEDFNSNQRKAFRFYELIDPVKETELPFDRSYLNLHFILKETGCLQTSVKNLHQCRFFESKPRMDCVGCFIAGSDHFEEEFIDCVQRNQVTKEIQNKRDEECDKLHPYHLGGIIALASRQESER